MVEEQKLSPVSTHQQNFGQSVAIRGSTVVVGASTDNDSGQWAGAVYVFRYDGEQWRLQQKLFAEDGSPGDEFGHSVDIEGDLILVGALSADNSGLSNTGAVYAFQFDGSSWLQVQKLISPSLSVHEAFGASLEIDGTSAILSARGFDGAITDSGAAYIYRWNGSSWVLQQRLEASDPAARQFGFSVALYGEFALVGANKDSEPVTDAGSAYLFRYDGASWNQVRKLANPGSQSSSEFGFSVAVCRDLLVVGTVGGASMAGAGYVYELEGGIWMVSDRLEAPSPTLNDLFGYSVECTETWFAVGVMRHSGSGDVPRTGQAHIYRRISDEGSTETSETWEEHFLLSASDGVAGDHFGGAIDADGDVVVVGANQAPSVGPGAAYIYRFNGYEWVEEEKLAPVGTHQQNFGQSVAIRGSTVVVGASTDGDNGQWAGAVYVFRYNGAQWRLEQKLFADDARPGDEFGHSVDVDDNLILVGALSADNSGLSNTGAVYAFQFDGSRWMQVQKLISPSLSAHEAFGSSLEMDATTAIVSALRFDGATTNSGAAYIYRWNGSSWVLEQRLEASDPAARQFGFSVALYGEFALVGANQDSEPVADAGSAYLFMYDGAFWNQVRKLANPGPQSDSEFGFSVVVCRDLLIVGTVGGTSTTGAGYVYELEGEVWVLSDRLEAPSPSSNDLFGWSVECTETWFAVGAMRHSGPQDVPRTGQAHIYRRISDEGSTEATATETLADYGLAQNYPNPFNPMTTISFTVRQVSRVKLSVFDLLGRRVSVVADQMVGPGSHSVIFDASDLASQTYLYRLEAAGIQLTKALTVVK